MGSLISGGITKIKCEVFIDPQIKSAHNRYRDQVI